MLSAFNCFLTVSKRYESNIFVGYWSREVPEIAEAAGDKDGNYCVRWDQVTKQTYFDGAWRFGRTIGVLGAMISLLLLIFTFYIIFFRIGSRVFFRSVSIYHSSLTLATNLHFFTNTLDSRCGSRTVAPNGRNSASPTLFSIRRPPSSPPTPCPRWSRRSRTRGRRGRRDMRRGTQVRGN